jgi:MFS family permease
MAEYRQRRSTLPVLSLAALIAACHTANMWTRIGWAAACFAAIMGFSRLAYGVLVPAMRSALGGNYALYGAIGGANLAGYLVGALSATRLARRPDRSRVNAVALGTMCLAMVASGLVTSTLELGLLRFLVGAASGVALSLTLALAVERVTPARRGVAAAVVWAGGALGIAIVGAGSLLLPLSLPQTWRVGWIAMGLAGGASSVVFARLTGGSFAAAERRDDGGAIGMLARAGYLPLTIGYAFFGVGYIDGVTFLGAALGRPGAPASGAVWHTLGLAGVGGAAVWGPLLDRYRSGLPVGAACLLCALGSLGFAIPGPGWLTLPGAFTVGFSFIGIPAMIGALLQQREPAERYPRAFASMTTGLGMGQIAGAPIGGLVADRLGATGALLFGAAALGLAGTLTALYRVPGTSALKDRLAERGEDQLDGERGRPVAFVEDGVRLRNIE